MAGGLPVRDPPPKLIQNSLRWQQRSAVMICKRILVLVLATIALAAASADEPPGAFKPFIEANCLDCHDRATKSGGLALDDLLTAGIDRNTEPWEKVVHKLNARQMPPKDAPRPDERSYDAAIAALESSLDRAAAAKPHPGRTETFRRLNRTEYQNTIRDLLALEIDAAALLPADESSHGFDNITISDLSATLLNRYVSAAQKISRMAIGRVSGGPSVETFRMRADITQDVHLPGLPIGTRGGMLINHHFPQDGEYDVQVNLMRDRNDEIESLREPHEMEISLDRERVELLDVRPAQRGTSDRSVEANLKTRVKVAAGPHQLAV